MTHADNQDGACQGANILIIDDDEGMAYTLGRMVQEEGHRSCAVHNLRVGLALATFGEYEVVFLDVRLPDGSGIDIIPQIQATPAAPEIIIITAYGDRGDAQAALKNGVWDYIEISALRERKNDIKEIAHFHKERLSQRTSISRSGRYRKRSWKRWNSTIGRVMCASSSAPWRAPWRWTPFSRPCSPNTCRSISAPRPLSVGRRRPNLPGMGSPMLLVLQPCCLPGNSIDRAPWKTPNRRTSINSSRFTKGIWKRLVSSPSSSGRGSTNE